MKYKSRTFSSTCVFVLSLSFILLSFGSLKDLQSQAPDETRSEFPLYTQVEFSSVYGEIFINPKYTGETVAVKASVKSTDNTNISEVRKTAGGWAKITVPRSLSDVMGVLITGRKGSLRISSADEESSSEVGEISPLDDLVIGFGGLSTTFLMPFVKISDPGDFGVDVLDHKENKFISGDVIAVKRNQIAVKFRDLPSTVVNQNGMIRVSIKNPQNSFISADLKAWGYDISVPDIETGKPVPIKANIFGLPQETKLRFTFTSLSGQQITPSSKILTVGEINSGTPIATISTSIPGTQPLSVVVERVN
jgi:hypothetical protein